MKKIAYFLEFILIKILFLLFQLIGYRLSSDLGFFIGLHTKKINDKNLNYLTEKLLSI